MLKKVLPEENPLELCIIELASSGPGATLITIVSGCPLFPKHVKLMVMPSLRLPITLVSKHMENSSPLCKSATLGIQFMPRETLHKLYGKTKIHSIPLGCTLGGIIPYTSNGVWSSGRHPDPYRFSACIVRGVALLECRPISTDRYLGSIK
ncbi:hypothetical protein BJV78DRAFT_144833 [Lactifluus subvellereus]|nr:hypothetical protein BJV78DRAFT_144833 [Lactifluus subvellereus]